MHVDRFIVELLRTIMVAVRHGDGGEDEQRGTVLHGFATSAGGLARLECAGDSLLLVAEFQGGKALEKQRMRDDPLVIGLPAQRQRLGQTRAQRRLPWT